MRKIRLWIKAASLTAILLLNNSLITALAAQPEAAVEEKDPNAPPDSFNWEVQSDAYPGWPAGPQTAAETAVLMDLDSGQILYAKGIDEKRYPASTTKIMTALIAMESKPLTDQITFSAEAVNSIEPGSTHIGIKPGEILTMEQSLYAILLASANEVSNGVAEYTAGTIPEFVDMMNERAANLGCKNTHFMNPSGLHHEEHYTTARDLAVIACAAFRNPVFRSITKTEYFIVPKTNITDEERWLNNHHKMLTPGDRHYEGCVGGKTGYTMAAGNTLVTYAERDGRRLVAVVLADNTAYQYPDTAALLDYGFGSFHQETLSTGGKTTYVKALPLERQIFQLSDSEVVAWQPRTVTVCLPEGIASDSLTAKTSYNGSVLCTDYYLGEQYLLSSHKNIMKSPSISKMRSQLTTTEIKSTAQKKDNINTSDDTKWKYPALIFMTAAILFYTILIIIKIKRRRKKRRRKRKKQKKNRK